MDERIHRYFQDTLTSAERKELLQTALHNAELKKQMVQYQHLHTLTGLIPTSANKQEGENHYKKFKQNRKNKELRYSLLKLTGYAAALAIIILSVWITSAYHSQKKLLLAVTQQQQVYVPFGQRACVTLPDGTTAWLNANTTLTYPSVFGKERKVQLSGEGFFNVAKNPGAPFIVTTRNINIRALGTQFNVSCYPSTPRITASLVEGKIKIYSSGNENKGIILTPNQQALIKDGEYKIETMKDQDNLLWKEGIYNFDNEPLGEIIKKLELYYDTSIIVKDSSILNYRYTGKFRQRNDVSELLRMIQKIHKFNVEKDYEHNRIILSE